MNIPPGLPANPTMRDITRWSERMRTRGLPICVCAQGTIDIPGPSILLEKLFVDAARDNAAHRYPPQVGLRELREAVIRHLLEKERIATDLRVEGVGESPLAGNNLLICSGVNGGFIAALHFIKEKFGPEAKCGLLDPSYLYHDLDVMAVFGEGAVHLAPREDLGIDRVEIEKALSTDKLKALLVCNPANPHGLLLTEEEIHWLVEVTQRHGAFVLFDEIYAHIHEAGQSFKSALHVLRSLPEHVVVVRGWSKLLGLQGDRLACLIAHDKVLPSILRWHDVIYIGVNGVAQQAMTQYLTHHAPDLERHQRVLNQLIEENTRVLAPAFEQALGWKLIQGPRTGRSTIYRMLQHDRATDMEALLTGLQRGVAAAPGNIFYGPSGANPFTGARVPSTGMVRLSLAMPLAAVKAGAQQLLSGEHLF